MRCLSSRAVRLFLIAWILYAAHFSTNIVREHYPAFALAGQGTFRVDPYRGFHADIFDHTDGHAYVCNNVLASVVAAVPLFLFDPLLDALEARSRARLEAAGGAVDVEMDTQYPNSQLLWRMVRERGLELRFGAAAAITAVFLMAPLCAACVAGTYRLLRSRAASRERALPLALCFGFATPLFYRAPHLNHNVLLMAALYAAFLLLWERPERPGSPARRAGAGFLCGVALALDYAGVIPAAVLAAYLLWTRWSARGPTARDHAGALRDALPFALAALPPVAFLLWSQWVQFGDPLRPAQFYMPAVSFTEEGLRGMTWPRLETFVKNLLSPSWGLVPCAPLLVFGFWPPSRKTRPDWIVPARERRWLALLIASFLLFCSANQYALMQFNTGFRYLMPLVPFLFLMATDHLARMRGRTLAIVGVACVMHTWVLTTTRQYADTEKDLRDLAIRTGVSEVEVPGYWRALFTETAVPLSYKKLASDGPDLPWLRVLRSTSLGRGTIAESRLLPVAILILAGGACALVWILGERAARSAAEPARAGPVS